MTPVDRAQRYISQVLSGEVAACKWVRLACQRQLNDLANRELGFSFDVNRDRKSTV